MSEAEFIGKCQECEGTGVNRYQDEEGNWHERPCPYCGADGKIEVPQYINTTQITTKLDNLQSSVGSLQTNLDQVAGLVKEQFEYIKKIYEIVSKGG